MLIGYARVSTKDQDPRLQVDALEAAGCTRIFVDEGVSGAATFKPQLTAALAATQPGRDTLVVWRLDRLSRSTRDLIDTVEGMKANGIGLRSLKEAAIDTTTPSGNLIFQIFGVLAEYERNSNLERTMAGIVAAREAGTRFGRRSTIIPRRWIEAKALLNADPPKSVAAVAALLGVSRQAVYRRIAQDAAEAEAHADAVEAVQIPSVPARRKAAKSK
jgi:DNA invertase Pin-like site-specific DNA recombinase